jgi:hypothetical protein
MCPICRRLRSKKPLDEIGRPRHHEGDGDERSPVAARPRDDRTTIVIA